MTLQRRTALSGLGALVSALVSALLAGCVTVGSGEGTPVQLSYELSDVAPAPTRRDKPLVDALLIQPLPGSALADTASMAYSRQPNEFAFYQLATWTERPVRHLPRLVQRRLEARGVATAVGLVGEPLRGDWLLTLSIETLHHDVAAPPGTARFAMTAEIYDRRNRSRLARQQFTAQVATARADSAAAADALSRAFSTSLDEMLPWLETQLQRGAGAAP